MRLVVYHYHDRPGGVRTAIGQGLPALVAAHGGVREVVLAGGSWTDRVWREDLMRAIHPVPLRTIEDPALEIHPLCDAGNGRDAQWILEAGIEAAG